MSVATEFHNWQQHKPEDDPRFNSCSPNLTQLGWELGRVWQMTNNGCYSERDVRAGQAPSSHSHGAATDRNYPDRTIAVQAIIPWLIDHSDELHLQAIHDYFGCRIWRAGRTANTADAHTSWWKAQPSSPLTGMGQSWAKYFHLETNLSGWHDNTPIAQRLGDVVPVPVPPSGAAVFTRTIKLGDQGADVAFVQTVLRAPGSVNGDKNIIVDGKYGTQTEQTMKRVQQATGLQPDGVIGPKTQAVIMTLANS